MVLAHAFCNWLGLPRFWGRVDEERGFGEGGDGGERLGVLWSVGYYVLLVGGAVGFYSSLWYLTESEGALVGV